MLLIACLILAGGLVLAFTYQGERTVTKPGPTVTQPGETTVRTVTETETLPAETVTQTDTVTETVYRSEPLPETR